MSTYLKQEPKRVLDYLDDHLQRLHTNRDIGVYISTDTDVTIEGDDRSKELFKNSLQKSYYLLYIENPTKQEWHEEYSLADKKSVICEYLRGRPSVITDKGVYEIIGYCAYIVDNSILVVVTIKEEDGEYSSYAIEDLSAYETLFPFSGKIKADYKLDRLDQTYSYMDYDYRTCLYNDWESKARKEMVPEYAEYVETREEMKISDKEDFKRRYTAFEEAQKEHVKIYLPERYSKYKKIEQVLLGTDLETGNPDDQVLESTLITCNRISAIYRLKIRYGGKEYTVDVICVVEKGLVYSISGIANRDDLGMVRAQYTFNKKRHYGLPSLIPAWVESNN